MKTSALTAAICLLLAVSATAQVKNGIEHTPGVCIRGGEMPLLQVTTHAEGELRGYFRRINTTDWCSVEGTNEGPLSRVVLPKFEAGDEIEYFFVLIQGVRIQGRSTRIYRARVTADCDAPFARHMIRFSMSCGEDAQTIPSSVGAGFLLGEITKGDPPYASPDRPNQ